MTDEEYRPMSDDEFDAWMRQVRQARDARGLVRKVEQLRAEKERLCDAIRDLLDELADQGVDTVHHPARQLVAAEGGDDA